MMGISRSYVSRIEKKALEKLRSSYEQYMQLIRLGMKMLRRIRIYLVFYENEYNCSEICILLRMQRIRKGIFMLQMLYPDEYLDSTYTIDFKKLYKDGYRGILFDIDNTLVPHGAPADKRAVALFKKLREIGFQTCLISNNKEPRVKSFCGDQIFTDVLGAKRAGLHAIMVKPIHPKEEIQIVLKRYLEKVVLFFYFRSIRKKSVEKQRYLL